MTSRRVSAELSSTLTCRTTPSAQKASSRSAPPSRRSILMLIWLWICFGCCFDDARLSRTWEQLLDAARSQEPKRLVSMNLARTFSAEDNTKEVWATRMSQLCTFKLNACPYLRQ